MIVAGVDGGSRAVKVVILDATSDLVLASGERDQSVHHEDVAKGLMAEVLERKDLAPGDVKRIVATGYTRNLLRFAHTTMTEITCHAQGVRRQHPDALTIVEVGGQDSNWPEKKHRVYRAGSRLAAIMKLLPKYIAGY